MSAALQVYYTRFDAAFFKLPPPIQTRIESRIDEMGLRLATFSPAGHPCLRGERDVFACLTRERGSLWTMPGAMRVEYLGAS